VVTALGLWSGGYCDVGVARREGVLKLNVNEMIDSVGDNFF
jgi:hypothetical protein